MTLKHLHLMNLSISYSCEVGKPGLAGSSLENYSIKQVSKMTMVSCKSVITLEIKHKAMSILVNRARHEPDYWVNIFLFVPTLVGLLT